MTGTYSENIMLEIVQIADDQECSIIEACVEYCEEHDLEPDELIEWLDPLAIAQLRQSALVTNKVRRIVAVPATPLEFE